jgi:hypothetical protein
MKPRNASFRFFAVVLVAASAATASDIQTSGQLISTAAVGTPPLAVTSTTRVDNLNAQYLDGWGAQSFLHPLDNVITVSPSGGDFTSIQSALDSISDAAFDNAYTVLVGPGIYAERVTLKSYVSVVGAGLEATEIVATGGETIVDAATVTGADDSVLRGVTVRSDASAGSTYAVGLVSSPGQPLLQDMEIIAIGGTDLSYGIYNSGTDSLVLEHVSIHAVDATKVVGIFNYDGWVGVVDSFVRAYGNTAATVTKYAIENAGEGGGVASVESSTLSALTSYLVNVPSKAAYMFYSTLSGGALVAGGLDVCLFVNDGSTGYASSCP